MALPHPPDEPNFPDQRSADTSQMDPNLRRRLDELGFPRPISLDENLAPDVDWDVLRALARGELEDEYARLVYRLIYSFQSWRDAHSNTLVEEYRRHANQRHTSGERLPPSQQ